MKQGLEIGIFVIVAIALHILAFAQGPSSGQQAGGNGGEAMISIQAAAPTVVEMVKTWERPPVIMPIVQNELAPPRPAQMETPAAPQVELNPAPKAAARVAITEPEIEQDIKIVTAPQPPPEEPEIEAEPVSDTRPRSPQPANELKADQASERRQKDTALGSGKSPQAGTSNAKVSTGDPGENAQLRAVWGAKIRARIDRNKRYPRGTKASGDVTIELQVSRDGKLLSYRLRSSSGVPELDKAAMDAIARSKRFPEAPKKLVGESFRFSVSIKLTSPRR